MKNSSQVYTWEKDISIVTNPLLFKQLAIVSFGAGLFMAVVFSIILLIIGDYGDIPPLLLVSLLTAVGLFLLLLLVSLVYFRNRIRVRFTVDSRGALWETIDKRAISGARLAILGGILGRNPQAAGAGLLAAAREKEYASWNQLSAVEYRDKYRMIVLRNSWRPVMMIVCLPENYEEVANYIRDLEKVTVKKKD